MSSDTTITVALRNAGLRYMAEELGSDRQYCRNQVIVLLSFQHTWKRCLHTTINLEIPRRSDGLNMDDVDKSTQLSCDRLLYHCTDVLARRVLRECAAHAGSCSLHHRNIGIASKCFSLCRSCDLRTKIERLGSDLSS